MILAPKYKFKPPGTPKIIVPSLRKNLVGYWLLNESSGGRAFDLSGNGLDFSPIAGKAFPDWRAGKYGSSLLFNGVDQHLHNASFPTVSLPWTMNFWIKWPAVGADERIIDFESGRLIFQLDDSVDLRVYEGNWNSSSISPSANIWYFITLVGISASSCKIYSNAIERSITVDALTGLGGRASIGSHNDGASAFASMQISHFSIYDRALSASEITLLYQEPFCMFGHTINPRLVHLVTIPAVGGQTHQIEGSISAESTVAGNLRANRYIQGEISSESEVSGNLTKQIVNISGSISSESTISANATVNRYVSGNIDKPESTISGSLTVTGATNLTGSISVETTVSGNIRVDRHVSGEVSSESTISGNARADKYAAGSIDKPETTVSGTIHQPSNALSGSIDKPETTVSGNLSQTSNLAGNISPETTVAGTLTVTGVFWAGSISAETELSGTITKKHWREFALEEEENTFETVSITGIKSGATQAAASAAANELWKTDGHASLPDNVILIGV